MVVKLWEKNDETRGFCKKKLKNFYFSLKIFAKEFHPFPPWKQLNRENHPRGNSRLISIWIKPELG